MVSCFFQTQCGRHLRGGFPKCKTSAAFFPVGNASPHTHSVSPSHSHSHTHPNTPDHKKDRPAAVSLPAGRSHSQLAAQAYDPAFDGSHCPGTGTG